MTDTQTFTDTQAPASLAALSQAREEVTAWLTDLLRAVAHYYNNLQPDTLRFKQMLIDFDKQSRSLSKEQFQPLFSWLALDRYMLSCLQDTSKQGVCFVAAQNMQSEVTHQLENNSIPDFDPCSDFVFFLRTLIDAAYPLVSEPQQERLSDGRQ